MEYSDNYLRDVLPHRDPPREYVPSGVEEEISSWGELGRDRNRALIARSTRWTYAIKNELRLNQVSIGFPDFYPLFYELVFYDSMVGLFDFKTEIPGFGLIHHIPNINFPRRSLDEVYFPRLDARFSLLLRQASYVDHGIYHPKNGTSTSWAKCNSSDMWGIITAGHVMNGLEIGDQVSLEKSQTGLLASNSHPFVDCAFIETAKPKDSLALLTTLRFPATGYPVVVECKTGPVRRTVVAVETNMGVIDIRSYGIKVFLNDALKMGDSGAIVTTEDSRAVAIYLGSLTTPEVPTGIAGRALNFEQAIFNLNVTAYR